MIILKILLFPFTIIYNAVTRFRNHLFDLGNKPSFEFETNVIGVGNLSVGGTGKTPMVEYLIRLLEKKHQLTTLSRGYGRKTKGFRIANEKDSPVTIGDEPFQIFNKFKSIHVTVGEERALAIPEIIHNIENNEVIIMDDAFQHRYVKPNLNILLTDFSKPFFNDFVLPSGRLREARKGAERADIIVVSKCPKKVSEEEGSTIKNQIKQYTKLEIPVFFSTISYDKPISFLGSNAWNDDVILFTGIANNTPVVNYVKENYNLKETITFSDHHNYSKSDVEKIKARHNSHNKCSLLTTEKDMVKLLSPEFSQLLEGLALFYLPIKTAFLENGEIFDEMVLNSVESNR